MAALLPAVFSTTPVLTSSGNGDAASESVIAIAAGHGKALVDLA